MGFLTLTSALIAAAVTLPALVSLYFLKLKRRKRVVPSTLLWKKTIHEMQVNSPFQRLRKNLLLLLQLLLLIALLIAFARPHTSGVAASGQQTIIVIDHSGSMNATDIEPTRLGEAKRQALDLVDRLDFEDETAGGAMVVSFAQRATVVQPFTTDRRKLRQAIRNIQPTDQASNLAAALALVEPFAIASGGDAGEPVKVRVFSDGRVLMPEGERLALKDAELEYQRIGKGPGQPRNNIALVAASARRDLDKPQIVQLLGRIANYGPEEITTNVTLELDGRIERIDRLTLPPAQTPIGPDGQSQAPEPSISTVQFDMVVPGATLATLSLGTQDLLPADNEANLVIAPSRRLRVLLVTEGNAFLDRVIRSVGVRELVTMSPQQYETQNPQTLRRGDWEELARGSGEGGSGFDVILFDAYSPRKVPPVSSLYLGAAPPIEGLELRPPHEDDEAAQYILDWLRDHPLMRWVVLDDVILSKPGRLVVPNDATVLATGQSGPIIAELRHDQQRHVATSFNILASNWPLYVSFPVFVSNALQTLGQIDSASVAYHTGQNAVIPVTPEQRYLIYTGPQTLEAHINNGRAILPAFPRAGVYEADEEMPQPYDRLPANMLDINESQLAPAQRLEVGTVLVDAAQDTATIRLEIWRYFVWAALGLLVIEWLFYTRRMHL